MVYRFRFSDLILNKFSSPLHILHVLPIASSVIWSPFDVWRWEQIIEFLSHIFSYLLLLPPSCFDAHNSPSTQSLGPQIQCHDTPIFCLDYSCAYYVSKQLVTKEITFLLNFSLFVKFFPQCQCPTWNNEILTISSPQHFAVLTQRLTISVYKIDFLRSFNPSTDMIASTKWFHISMQLFVRK
jgi:hypothetical protein